MRTSKFLFLVILIVARARAAEQTTRVADILHGLAGEHRANNRGVDAAIGARGAWHNLAGIIQDFAAKYRVLSESGAQMLRASTDGRYIAGRNRVDDQDQDRRVLTVWDAHEARVIDVLRFAQKIRNIAFPSPSLLIVLLGTEVHFFNVSRGGVHLIKNIDLVGQVDKAMWAPSVVISPNNRFLALEAVAHSDTTQRDCNAFVWDLHNLNKKPKKVKEVCRGSFSFDGHYFASMSYYWDKARLWYKNFFGWFSKKIKMLDGDTVDSFLFSPNGQYLVALGKQSRGHAREIKIWNVHDLKQAPIRLACDAKRIEFSPDGQHLAALMAHDNALAVWNMHQLHEDPIVLSLAISDERDYRPLQTLFGPDQCVVVRDEEKIMIHTLRNPQAKPHMIEGRFNDMVFTQQQLITASDDQVRVWDWDAIIKDMKSRNEEGKEDGNE